ncbi:hypothetical protein [Selenomonas sp. oral taxon 478]|uniref:hypothetical protein n=1 Tax=Selenomonas sp. oral taxon 478 TaxID=712538 RepID=UPI000679F4F8|nr:hypothetical protein [Selenomonas sp. oral taxon 478]AKT54563.1 hypothetical protein ADJ74_08970 [Selenomonas sp. oral taxon 478]
MPIEANATAAAAAVSAPQRISSERPTEGVQGRGDQENASAAFSQRTNVSIETAIDRMADVLSKISGRQQTNVEQIPQELKEVIRNIIRQSFSIESTLAQGLGSTAASQRFSTDQLTTLARMLNQMGTMAETNEVPRVSDDVATLLAALKSAIAKDAGGTFEPIMLTKAAFQLIDTGNAELLPKDLQTVLSQLNASAGTAPAAANGGGTSSMTFLNQLVQLLMPRDAEAATQQGGTQSPVQTGEAQATPQQGSAALSVEEGAAQMPASGQTVRMTAPAAGAMQNPAPAATAASDTAAAPEELPADNITQGAKQGEGFSAPSAKGTEAPALRQADTAAVGIGTKGNAAPSPSAAEAQRGQGAEVVQGSAAQQGKTAVQQETSLPQGSAPARQEGTGGTLNPARQPVGEEARTGTAEAAKQTPQSTEQAARSQAGRAETAAAQPPASTMQGSDAVKTAETPTLIPKFITRPMENVPQMMSTLRDMARVLLQNENLSQRETLLLQNFVSGRTQTLSEGDAKQLQQLIQLTQQNIPGTVRQAAFEQQMPDLPRLWAFMQMADLVKVRKMTAEQYRRAGRDVAALALTMRHSLEGENAAPQPGQRSMSYVMPLFMGETEYPAYIHVYDESHKDEATDQVKKETWLRICVLTDHIGTVELINRIYEENHVDMRLYFSDADAAWEFRNELDSIRESADGTSLVIEGIQIGAIGERRFFTN